MLALLCAAVSPVCLSQDFPKAEVYGGGSYLNLDTNGLTSRQNAGGWETAVDGNFTRNFGVEFDVSGHYKTVDNISISDYAYLAGPRVNFRPFFVHALLGGDHLGAEGASQDGFAGMFGGGVDQQIHRSPWSFRLSGDYVFTRHNILGGPSVTQNNFHAGIGIAYSFGSKAARDQTSTPATISNTANKRSSGSRASMEVSSLGVIVSPRQDGEDGAEIVDVIPGGVGELARFHQGDVIIRIDATVIRTPMELAAAMANLAPGSQVHVRYEFKASAGVYEKETIVVLPKQ
jgi:hypothetical protein